MSVDRRNFVSSMFAGSAAAQVGVPPSSPVTIERRAEGTPHKGRVLALITPHLDDGPIFAGGTIAKLLAEGYKGYFIRTSNDEKDSYNLTLGETVLANERDTAEVVRTFGLERAFDLSYRNHRMDDVCRTEIRGRLVFLFRLLGIDTVFSYDPWGHYEENPDHYVTAQAVEAACWMSGGKLDYPEHFAAGLKPRSVREKYYFARGPQLVNRVVDITTTVDAKMAAIRACRTMILHMVGDARDALTEQKLKLPSFAADENTDIRSYVELAFKSRDAAVGAKYQLPSAEEFHYIGPDRTLEAALRVAAVPL